MGKVIGITVNDKELSEFQDREVDKEIQEVRNEDGFVPFYKNPPCCRYKDKRGRSNKGKILSLEEKINLHGHLALSRIPEKVLYLLWKNKYISIKDIISQIGGHLTEMDLFRIIRNINVLFNRRGYKMKAIQIQDKLKFGLPETMGIIKILNILNDPREKNIEDNRTEEPIIERKPKIFNVNVNVTITFKIS